MDGVRRADILVCPECDRQECLSSWFNAGQVILMRGAKFHMSDQQRTEASMLLVILLSPPAWVAIIRAWAMAESRN